MHNERGIILLVVVWSLMVLMVIALELGRTARVEGISTDVYQQEAKTYYLAMAGLNRALYQLVRTGQRGRARRDRDRAQLDSNGQGLEECPDAWRLGDGQWKSESFGEGGYQVRVSDESGKININQVDEIILRQTFTNLDFDPDVGDALADAILDWRDPDSLERLNGVESDYYLAQDIPYPAKDGPFDVIDELLLIRGVSQDLFDDTLREVFTVYGNARAGNMANLMTAGPWVLMANRGVDAQTAEEMVRQRQETCGEDFLDGTVARGGLPTIVTIESVGYLNTGRITRRLSGVVQRTGGQSFRMLRWQDRLPASDVPLQKTTGGEEAS
ncbi:MAG: hypothetical protein AAEI08_07785 [Gammaproteobacteria bacterium]